jgi:hypothetical protein
MIADDAANDGAAEQQPVITAEGRPVALACSSVSSVMISDARRRRSTTCDQSRSLEGNSTPLDRSSSVR